jgi:hypothetical protein
MTATVGIGRKSEFINLGDFRFDVRLYRRSYPTPIGGDRDHPRSKNIMLNIVEKYTAETDVQADEGVVAIEYVITAAALVVALAALWAAFGTTLTNRLNAIVRSI